MAFAGTVLRIGGIEVTPATVAAPMASISNPPYRAACLEMGCGLATTEMVAAQQMSHPRIWRKKPPFERAAGERWLHVQVFGNRPEVLAEGARAAEAHGADALDVNLGCPARKVVSSGSGAALGREAATAAAAVEAVVRATRLPVTAKVRLGWDDDHRNLLECAAAIEAAGAAAITVHPRTRMQMFGGRADWTWIARVVERVRIPVIGNGDVRSAADAERMRAETGCAAVMIGRAAMGRPWIFRELLEGRDGDPPPEERLGVFRRYVERYVGWAGEDRAVRELRKHLLWFVRGVPGAAAFRNEALRVSTAGDVERLLLRAAELWTGAGAPGGGSGGAGGEDEPDFDAAME